MRFFGFESSLHGISAFDWSIGSTPNGEDIQPYMEHGIVHNEEDNVPGYGKIFYWNFKHQFLTLVLPASVAQLDALSDWRPGGCGFNPSRGR